MIQKSNMPEGQERAVVKAEANLQDWLNENEDNFIDIYEDKLEQASEDADTVTITGADIIRFGLAEGKSEEFLRELIYWYAEIPTYDECKCKYCDNVHHKPIDLDMFGEYFEWERND